MQEYARMYTIYWCGRSEVHGEYARVSAIVCINILAEHEVTG